MSTAYNGASLPSNIHTWKHNNWVNTFTIDQLMRLSPVNVTDVGCGDGFYGKLLRHILPHTQITGIELNIRWYNHCLNLGVYDTLHHTCIIDKISHINGEIIIFGDILEHLEKSDMEYVLEKAVHNFDFVLLNGPVGFQPQDHEDPEEIHRCGITKEDLVKYTILEYNQSDFDNGNNMMNCLLQK